MRPWLSFKPIRSRRGILMTSCLISFRSPQRFAQAVRKVRARLKRPVYSMADYLEILKRQGLTRTVTQIEQLMT